MKYPYNVVDTYLLFKFDFYDYSHYNIHQEKNLVNFAPYSRLINFADHTASLKSRALGWDK